MRAAALATFFVVVQFYTSFAALAATPNVGYSFASPAVAGALIALLAGSAICCAVLLGREGALAGRTPSHAILAAWLGATLVASAFGVDPVVSFEVAAMTALAAAFHLGVVRWFGRPGVAPALLGSYLATGAAAALAGIAFDVARRPQSLWVLNHGRAAGIFVTANQFAAFLIAYVFIAVGTGLAWRGALRRLAFAGAALGALALAASLSLAGLLGAAVAAIWYASVLGARRTAAGLAVGALALAVLGAVVRPAAAHNPADDFDRLRLWRSGLRVASLFPLSGAGPMGYWHVYPAIRPPNGDPPGTYGALHPHDAYLSLAADTGIIGLIATVYGWTRFLRAMRTGLRLRSPRERRFALGVCAALVAVLVQGIFDTIGIVQLTFVWIPFMALGLAVAQRGLAPERVA